MTYSSWKQWYRRLPFSVKWFIVILLLKPILDSFYALKEISPFFSPLYIVGILSPIFALYAIINLPKPNYSRLDTLVGMFSACIILSCATLLVSDSFSFDSLEVVFKFITPCYLYYFIRRLVRTKQDLHGVFQTFIYSSTFVMAVFSYELIFTPIHIQLSRGLERLQGNYADVMNYVIYMAFGLLLCCYAYIEKPQSSTPTKRIILLATGLVFSLLILLNIHHTASYVVIGAILILFMFHNIKANAGAGILIFIATIAVVYVVASGSFKEKILPLVATDEKVYEGEKDNDALLHGRVGRWRNFLEFFNEKNTVVQLLGLPVGFDHPYMYISKGSHNDFVRTLMFNGYIGLILYILLLINLIYRALKYKIPMHFLGLGSLTILILYSISTTPLLYPTLLYVLLPIVAVMALPKYIMDEPA